ncbi:hypothetical protein HDU82_004396 [Entophlyctis luteolus]|nr:hypothetical protein HDU82_004396 [Entophlyctis luteolus]
MRVLLIDNYDSYTFNLFQLLGPECAVVRNDQCDWQTLETRILPFVDCVVISPGPGTPEKTEDFGVCGRLIRNLENLTVPTFGVCLGHQGIASAFGGKVVEAQEPMHGRLSLPKELEAIAWASSGSDNDSNIIMALQHKYLPLWGVQFHPESVCTEFGQRLVENVLEMAKKFWISKDPMRNLEAALPNHISLMSVIPTPLLASGFMQHSSSFSKVKSAIITKLDVTLSSLSKNFCEDYFEKHLNRGNSIRFWLDSAKVEKGLSRFSYMGSCNAPQSYALTYSTSSRCVRMLRPSSNTTDSAMDESSFFLSDQNSGFFHFLSQSAASHGFWADQNAFPTFLEDSDGQTRNIDFEIPEFIGGYVGYFGYEMKVETMAHSPNSHGFQTVSAGGVPDSAFIFADKVVAVDHLTGTLWLISLIFENDGAEAEQKRRDWVQKTRSDIQRLSIETEKTETKVPKNALSFTVRQQHTEAEYIKNIDSALSSIKRGETYEVCLTTKVIADVALDAQSESPTPFAVYKAIRTRNPAPYGALLQFPQLGFSILQSSPERFFRYDGNGAVEMKPIKGTVARPEKDGSFENFEIWQLEDDRRKRELESNEKDRAENLMIVDLIRNDLNQISISNSVHVPHLMQVESYATVHQLVSTIRCKLRDGLGPLDAIRATFPPGSMTGAPKLRTVELIERLERNARGVYSGCLGFMSAGGGGVVDMSVVIRTAIMHEQQEQDAAIKKIRYEIGAGGAVVYLSDAESEYREMQLKANSVLPSSGLKNNIASPEDATLTL